MTSRSEWYWGGYAGHFIGGGKCRFHLSTIVGSYLISTVGDYRTNRSEQQETIGADRLYETMVFRCDGLDGDLNPQLTDLQELELVGYNDSCDAERGHYDMCEKWAGEQ